MNNIIKPSVSTVTNH